MNTESRRCQRPGCDSPLPADCRPTRKWCGDNCRSSMAKRGQRQERKALRTEVAALRQLVADMTATV